jgi:hypothetical protein
MGVMLSGARRVLVVVAALAMVTSIACESDSVELPLADFLPLGNWGGDSSAMIVSDTSVHLHISCTYGDVSGRISIQSDGSFNVPGSYTLRAYPIAVGPSVPARFVGQLSGNELTVSAIVTDTVQHAIVTRGPVMLKLGETPKLLPCPICRRPIVTKPPVFYWRI